MWCPVSVNDPVVKFEISDIPRVRLKAMWKPVLPPQRKSNRKIGIPSHSPHAPFARCNLTKGERRRCGLLSGSHSIESHSVIISSGRVKLDTCRFRAWRLALIGQGRDWLAQCQDNVNGWCKLPGPSVGQHYKVAISIPTCLSDSLL